MKCMSSHINGLPQVALVVKNPPANARKESHSFDP